jgi:glutamyl-tRNA(Gln) amidotransferase subunit E
VTIKPSASESKHPYPLADSNLAEPTVRVGLEIHQQLASENKLFCDCSNNAAETPTLTFSRKLRPAYSELGVYDPAALFEATKMKAIKYRCHPSTSCLVEADEEPPHTINERSLESALVFAMALHSKIVDEIHVMRKIVIDGSNTTGFQRTMLVATGGFLEIEGNDKVGVQSICLEEDAARLLLDNDTTREYSLDRLGVPLVEIALEPLIGTPKQVAQVALTLGRLLRASKRVERGIGTIRQDVNISIDGGGSVVEVKGIQQLDQLVKVIEFETIRQYGLTRIAAEVVNRRKKLQLENNDDDGVDEFKVEDVTDLLKHSASRAVARALENGNTQFKAIKAKGFHGLLGYEPYEGVRLGRQLAELVRFYGVGGVFHSDELPNYGISESEVKAIKRKLDIIDGIDAFVLIGSKKDRIQFAVDSIILRLKQSAKGVPPETRAATSDGKTIFIRPRPGSSRMYPETDVLPVQIDDSMLESLRGSVPKPFDSYIRDIMHIYHLNQKLAIQIFDSDRLSLFEDIVKGTKVQPTFVASKITEELTNLRRQGLPTDRLSDQIIRSAFRLLDEGLIVKESIPLIFETMLRKDLDDVDEAVHFLGLEQVSDVEVEALIDKIVIDNMPLIKEKGSDALGTLMGKSMSILRGKADGKKVNSILRNKIEKNLS